MTNAEKRGKEILEQLCKTGDWAVNKDTNEIVGCILAKETCQGNCLFAKLNCTTAKAKWLNSEYKTKKHFTEADKAVLRALDKVQWVARDEDGTVCGFCEKPHKGIVIWRCETDVVSLSKFSTTAKFTDIKWEDEEPTCREEILGEEK